MRIASSQKGRDRTPFIGRRQERERLGAELRRGAALVTLCGPSGIGKTRLARQVAGELVESFEEEGGVWFCSLVDGKTASDLEAAVARTLGIHQQQGDELDRSLANRGPLLLILDNADAVASLGGEVIARWLERCVELQLIVTSLVPTGAPEEVVLELRPLEPDDAVALYLDRATRAWANRSFSGEETSEVQDLVKRLDRLPLAIELAAARVRLLPPRTMLDMLEKRFDLLRTSKAQRAPADTPQRKSSLLGALELTWSHLTPAEQLALARAAVFEGGFTLEAAEAVFGAGGDEREISSDAAGRDLLDDLQRKSLLIREESRCFLLESVRDYALDQLRRMGCWEESIQRHAAFYLSQDDAQPQLGTEPRHVDSIRWLGHERANLIAIHHRFLETDPSLAARAGIALAPLILNLGHSSSHKSLNEATLDAAKRSGQPALILAALDTLQTSHLRHGRFDEAKAALAEQLEFARSSGEKEIEALALLRLALLNLDQGELESSRPALQRAALLSAEVGSPPLEAMTLLAQGREAIARGAHGEAEDHLARSILLLQRDTGTAAGRVSSLHMLSGALANQGRHLEARRAMLDTIEACRELGHRHFEAGILSHLAAIDLAAGLLDEADAACRQSLTIFRELGNRFREGEIIGDLGIISLERGELDAAADKLSQAEEILHECDAARVRIELLCFRVVVESRRGQLEEARQILDEVRAHPGAGKEELNPLFAEGAEGVLDVATARQLRAEDRRRAESWIERARPRLEAIRREHLGVVNYLPVLARLLERELTEWDAGDSAFAYVSSRPTLLFGAALDWVEPPGEPRIKLQHRRVLRAVFAVLAKARLERPGQPVQASELIAAGWSGADPSLDGSINRLHVAIWTLRDLGLRNVVQKTPTGYLLDPLVAVHVES